MNPNHTQIWKSYHIYRKGAYNHNNTECSPSLNQAYINKEALDGI